MAEAVKDCCALPSETKATTDLVGFTRAFTVWTCFTSNVACVQKEMGGHGAFLIGTKPLSLEAVSDNADARATEAMGCL